MANTQANSIFGKSGFWCKFGCPYPEPYLLFPEGLHFWEYSRNGEDVEYRFISNFLPIIDTVVEYDNGKTVEKNYLVKGFMNDGRELPIVTVDSSELLTLNWVVSKWDASCIIGTQYNAKERLRFALQTTTANAKRRLQCGYTGWKQLDGKWNYLLPGHSSCEVVLRGKLRSYWYENGATEQDRAILSGLLEVPFAPIELLYPTIALVFLSPLNEFLRRAEREPKFIPAIVGRTGSMKTSYLSFRSSEKCFCKDGKSKRNTRECVASAITESFLTISALTRWAISSDQTI